MKALVIGILVTLACTGCRQEEPVVATDVVEVGFREEEYVLEIYDVADLFEGSGQPPACLVDAKLVQPSRGYTAEQLLEKSRRVVGPAGETEFAHFEIHRGCLIVSLPPPEHALVASWIRNLRRDSSLFVEYAYVELSKEEVEEISPEYIKVEISVVPDLREKVETLKPGWGGAPALTGVASGWICLPFATGPDTKPIHGLHVRTTPSADRKRLFTDFSWDPKGPVQPAIEIPDRKAFMIWLPNPSPAGPYAIAVRPRLVALDSVLFEPESPLIRVEGNQLKFNDR